MNKEQFEELLCWLQLPSLLKIAEADTQEAASLQEVERAVSQACRDAKDAGYRLETYLQRSAGGSANRNNSDLNRDLM